MPPSLHKHDVVDGFRLPLAPYAMLFFCICQVMNTADLYYVSRALDAVLWEEVGPMRHWLSFPALVYALRHWMQRLWDAPSPLVLAAPAGLVAAPSGEVGCTVWKPGTERTCGNLPLFRDHGTTFGMCETHFKALIDHERMTHRFSAAGWGADGAPGR